MVSALGKARSKFRHSVDRNRQFQAILKTFTRQIYPTKRLSLSPFLYLFLTLYSLSWMFRAHLIGIINHTPGWLVDDPPMLYEPLSRDKKYGA